MGSYLSWFKKKDPRKPVKGLIPRLKNVALLHFRGILGTIIPVLIILTLFDKERRDISVVCIWMIMFSTLVFQPVAIPACGLLPLFLLPMLGVVNSTAVSPHYFNDSICFYILGGMLYLFTITNNYERRFILWILNCGGNYQFSGGSLVFKASTAAFFLSFVTNRLNITSTVIQCLLPSLLNVQSSTSGNRKAEPDYDEIRYIVFMAVQAASSIGSVTVLHTALTPLVMKAIWTTDYGDNKEYPDVFNYLQYTCFAFPTALFMLICNIVYYVVLTNILFCKPMPLSSMSEIKTVLKKQEVFINPFNFKQKLFWYVYLFFLIVVFFRWCDWFHVGWSQFSTVTSELPMIKDSTIAAAFLIILTIIPTNVTFWKYVIATSGGVALNAAVRSSGLAATITEGYGKFITNQPWNLSIFIVCLISVLLANIMPGRAACCMFLPFVLNMSLQSVEGVSDVWVKRVFLGALAVGIGTSMGFVCPFRNTPAYFCHYTGKVPCRKMIKYGLGSAIVCAIALSLSLSYYAPIIWYPQDEGIKSYTIVPSTTPPKGKKPPIP